MEERRPDPPANRAGQPPEGGPPPEGGLPPDAEHRPLGALAVVSFLTLTILVFWFGMYALNVVRN